jgi:hypothetical protein
MNESVCPQPRNLEETNFKIRELEIRLVGVDGNNGLTGRVRDLEAEMSKGFDTLLTRLETLSSERDQRLRALEVRVYLVCGVPAIVAATVATLKFLHLTQ